MLDASDSYQDLDDTEISEDLGASWCPTSSSLWLAPMPFDPEASTLGSPVLAFASQGRWVVECPDHPAAQLGCLTDARFMCVQCGNSSNKGAFLPVTYPPPAEIAQIAQILDNRPDVRANWDPAQSIAELVSSDPIDIPPGDVVVDFPSPLGG
jgi:hypothetical protein